MNWEKDIAPFFLQHGKKVVLGIIAAGITLLLVLKLDDITNWFAMLLKGDVNPFETEPVSEAALEPSFTGVEYGKMAVRLHEAMDRFGTDEKTIYSILGKLDNAVDLQMLTDAYGTRGASGYLENFEGTLVMWLKHELDENELIPVKAIYERLNTDF